MINRKYRLRFLSLFSEDLNEIVGYINDELNNSDAAKALVDDLEKAINIRLLNPKSFEKFKSSNTRKYPYYRIYVKNFMVFYVVYDDVMEVRRIIYNRRDSIIHFRNLLSIDIMVVFKMM